MAAAKAVKTVLPKVETKVDLMVGLTGASSVVGLVALSTIVVWFEDWNKNIICIKKTTNDEYTGNMMYVRFSFPSRSSF